jgi:hypothetical protein
VPNIVTDDAAIGTMAAEYLLHCGFKQFAYCGLVRCIIGLATELAALVRESLKLDFRLITTNLSLFMLLSSIRVILFSLFVQHSSDRCREVIIPGKSCLWSESAQYFG